MSWQSDVHFSKVVLCDMNKLFDAGDAIFFEDGGIALHLDGSEPVIHRGALQGVDRTAVAGAAAMVAFGFGDAA